MNCECPLKQHAEEISEVLLGNTRQASLPVRMQQTEKDVKALKAGQAQLLKWLYIGQGIFLATQIALEFFKR